MSTKEFDKQNIGFYRDDGLSCFENISLPDSEKINKKIIQNLQKQWIKHSSRMQFSCNRLFGYNL